MKKQLIISAALIGSLFTSCKKEDEPTPSGGGGGGGGATTTYHISMDSTYVTGDPFQTQVKTYEYNSNKKLVKVNYKYGTSTFYSNYDTIYYNTNGLVSKVEKYDTGNPVPNQINVYNYTSGVLTSLNESGTNFNGAYVRTRTFTYTSNKLSSQTVTYTTGMGDGGPENITSIVFTGDNISSVDAEGIGPVTLTTELTAANPYYGLNHDAEDFINFFNKNNVLKIFATADPANPFVDNTYTYSNGRVATITDNSSSPVRITAISYIGL